MSTYWWQRIKNEPLNTKYDCKNRALMRKPRRDGLMHILKSYIRINITRLKKYYRE